MTSFANAVQNPVRVRTTNGMAAFNTTGDSLVDLFFNIGSSRNDQPGITRKFSKAFSENKTLAARTLFWARDVRGGAGERETFRTLMKYLEQTDLEACKKLVPFVPEYGRWDDLLVFTHPEVKRVAYQTIALGLRSGDGLCAKWMPRKGTAAVELRNFMGMTPKQYRKTLVALTNVVEQAMCSNQWSNIDFGKLPSVASKSYMQAFMRHAPTQYNLYREALVKGDAKINASAIFPHDVIKGIRTGDATVGAAQWEALPNYLGDGDNFILPMVDVSGSMGCSTGPGATTQCIDVALALGLYLADKQKGAFSGMFLTFSAHPELQVLKGNIRAKMRQMNDSKWGMNTNIEAAFAEVLRVARQNNVPANEMPKMILIFSDMQFDACVTGANNTALEMARERYHAAGYELPRIVFWNLNASYGNQPVTVREGGTALVSGFSPAIMKQILSAETFSPEAIVLETINGERYQPIAL